MPATAQQIITQALGFSLANDQGQTLLAQDTAENLGVLNRLVAQVYTLAAMPGTLGTFIRTSPVTLASPATTPVALPAFVRVLTVTDAGGDYVAQVPISDVRLGIAETPPAVVVQDRTMRSVGRPGDPTAAAVLTVDGYYLPAPLTSASHFIGATTPTDASTSAWPDVGDSYLAASLASYWCRKDGTRDPVEQQSLEAEVARTAQALGDILGVATARLASVQVDDE